MKFEQPPEKQQKPKPRKKSTLAQKMLMAMGIGAATLGVGEIGKTGLSQEEKQPKPVKGYKKEASKEQEQPKISLDNLQSADQPEQNKDRNYDERAQSEEQTEYSNQAVEETPDNSALQPAMNVKELKKSIAQIKSNSEKKELVSKIQSNPSEQLLQSEDVNALVSLYEQLNLSDEEKALIDEFLDLFKQGEFEKMSKKLEELKSKAENTEWLEQTFIEALTLRQLANDSEAGTLALFFESAKSQGYSYNQIQQSLNQISSPDLKNRVAQAMDAARLWDINVKLEGQLIELFENLDMVETVKNKLASVQPNSPKHQILSDYLNSLEADVQSSPAGASIEELQLLDKKAHKEYSQMLEQIVHRFNRNDIR